MSDSLIGYGRLARTGPRTVIDTSDKTERSAFALRRLRYRIVQRLDYTIAVSADAYLSEAPYNGVDRAVEMLDEFQDMFRARLWGPRETYRNGADVHYARTRFRRLWGPALRDHVRFLKSR